MTQTRRIGEVAAQRDAERFVGREPACQVFAAALDGSSGHRIIHVSGPGGVGKSTLLRAFEREANERGRPVTHVDGRMVAPFLDGLAAALTGAGREGGVVIVDEVDELLPFRYELRASVMAEVPASAVVVTAGRQPPDPAWFDDGLDQLTTTIALRPLDPAESGELLTHLDVHDPERRESILRWSSGYPLALTVAASLQGSDRPVEPFGVAIDPLSDEVGEQILQRLAGRELADVDPDVLDVACVAAAVDARLLAAVMPGRSTRAGLATLRSLTVVERVGQRVALHRLVRTALRRRLQATDPDRYRTIVLRTAAHLRTRALTDDYRLMLELADLVQDPDLRLRFERSTSHYPDRVRPGDLETVAAQVGCGDTAWFGRLERWCDEASDQVLTVRRATGELSAIAVFCMGDQFPEWATDDIETGPMIRHAAEADRLDSTAFMHEVIILEDPTEPEVVAEIVRVGNEGAMARGAVRHPRYVYVTATALREGDGSGPLGYAPLPELDRSDDERSLITLVNDFGPEGVVGRIHDLILAEQGADTEASTGLGIALQAALRGFHDDQVMLQGPFGTGTGQERIDAARAEVRRLVDHAFGSARGDAELQRAIVRAYLDADGGHAVARNELHMSRSSFYRHLQRARDLLVERSAGEISSS